MTAHRIDGKALAREVQAQLREEAVDLEQRTGQRPQLAVVLVGDDAASKLYVNNKTRAALSCDIDVVDLTLPGDITNEDLQRTLRELSEAPAIDGILLQLPLPKGLDEYKAILSIAPDKDVDGLHPLNQGLLVRGAVGLRPCTPLGTIMLLERARRDLGLPANLDGMQAVIVGRSILVGKPLASMLLEKHCTVTVCHSRTRDLPQVCRGADVLVAAIGRAEIITRDFVKEGAFVLDVGINRRDDGRVVGDVAYEEVSETAAAITPVPGGVGPMTIAMLLYNTVLAAKRRRIPESV